MPKSQPLEYQAAEPAFLRRLKANNLALDGRHNVQIPHARGGAGGVNDRLNMKGEEGEDDPLLVDEDGNVISKDEMEERIGKKEEEGGVSVESGYGETGQEGFEKERKHDEGEADAKENVKVSSGFGKKRRLGKVILEDADGDGVRGGRDEDSDREPVKSLEDSTKDLKSVVGKGKEDAKKEEVGKKTKRKKIKLSFDEPE